MYLVLGVRPSVCLTSLFWCDCTGSLPFLLMVNDETIYDLKAIFIDVNPFEILYRSISHDITI